jgi:hypothetical protein
LHYRTYLCVLVMILAAVLRYTGDITAAQLELTWGVFGPLEIAALRAARSKQLQDLADWLEGISPPPKRF